MEKSFRNQREATLLIPADGAVAAERQPLHGICRRFRIENENVLRPAQSSASSGTPCGRRRTGGFGRRFRALSLTPHGVRSKGDRNRGRLHGAASCQVRQIGNKASRRATSAIRDSAMLVHVRPTADRKAPSARRIAASLWSSVGGRLSGTPASR